MEISEIQTIKCISCEKVYNVSAESSCDDTLNAHYKRSPMCQEWIKLLENPLARKIQADKIFNVKITTGDDFNELECKICQIKYSNIGNLHKHFNNNVICKKAYNFYRINNFYADYFLENGFNSNTEQTVEQNDSKLIHIIWNVFLTDKTSIDSIKGEIFKNRLALIVCILPDLSDNIENRLKDTNCSSFVDPLQFHFHLYGDDHNPIVSKKTLDEYKKSYDRIKELQDKRQNTLIFCNNGYQRSLPFLCYYLMNYHKEEVPNLDRALDIILSQVDPKNYMTIKETTKISLSMLRNEDLSNFL